MKVILTISASLLILTGCGMFGGKKVEPIADCEPVVKWFAYDCGTPPSRNKVDLTPPIWVIEEGTGDYKLTSDSYGDLGDATSDIEMALGQLRIEIAFYENCIAAAQSNIED